jgi:hypothetical protein
MEEWKEYKLEEVCSRLRSGKGIKSDCISNIGLFPVIGGNGMRGYTNKSNFKGECAVIGRQGANCGNVRFFMGEAYMTEHAVVAVGNELADSYFLARLLSLMHLGNLSAQSAQPGLSIQTLSKQIIRLPSISYQREISTVLKSLDDKIELNRRINDNLEQQAQALFKSWFVDFEPFKNGQFVDSELGKIPEGWKVGYLSEIADIIMGQSPNGSTYNENGEGIIFYQGRAEFGTRFPSIRLFTTNPTRIAPANSILISVRAPVGDINITHKECCIGRGLASAVSRTNKSAFLLYTLFSLKSDLDKFNAEGTVFGSINRKALETLKILIPTNDLISKFEAIVASMDQQILILHIESENLKILRDTLLPKLMSGELKINDINN